MFEIFYGWLERLTIEMYEELKTMEMWPWMVMIGTWWMGLKMNIAVLDEVNGRRTMMNVIIKNI